MVALPARLRENRTYILVYVHWMYFIFVFAIPFLVLFLVNGMVIMTIRRAKQNRRQLTRQQRKEHATATMMIVVTCAYLICTSLAFVLNSMELWGASGGQDVEIPQMDFSSVNIDVYERMISNRTVPADTEIFPVSHEDTVIDHGPKKMTRRHSNLFYFLIDLNNLLVMLHCSVNFLIYYKFSQRFRAHVKAFVFREDRGMAEGLTADGGTIENREDFSKSIFSRLNTSFAKETHFYYGSNGKTMRFTSTYPIRKRAVSMHSGGSCTSLIYNSPSNSPKSCSNADIGRRLSPAMIARTGFMKKTSL